MYCATEDGKIFSMFFVNGVVSKVRETPKEMKQHLHKTGYLRATLYQNGKRKHVLVQRIVLSAFKGSQPEAHEASHLDGCRTNNHISNLAWETKKVNHSRKREHGTDGKGSKKPHRKLLAAQVLHIRSELHGGKSRQSIANEMNIAISTVSSISNRRSWKNV
jgi:DNA-binding NarL/FixJ family response regulator